MSNKQEEDRYIESEQIIETLFVFHAFNLSFTYCFDTQKNVLTKQAVVVLGECWEAMAPGHVLLIARKGLPLKKIIKIVKSKGPTDVYDPRPCSP